MRILSDKISWTAKFLDFQVDNPIDIFIIFEIIWIVYINIMRSDIMVTFKWHLNSNLKINVNICTLVDFKDSVTVRYTPT